MVWSARSITLRRAAPLYINAKVSFFFYTTKKNVIENQNKVGKRAFFSDKLSLLLNANVLISDILSSIKHWNIVCVIVCRNQENKKKGEIYDIRQIHNQSTGGCSRGIEHRTAQWTAKHRTDALAEGSACEGKGRDDLHLPEAWRECHAGGEHNRRRIAALAARSGRTALPL